MSDAEVFDDPRVAEDVARCCDAWAESSEVKSHPKRAAALRDLAAYIRQPRATGLQEAAAIALAESMKAPQSVEHPWDRGYRAGAAAVWSKLRALVNAKVPT